MCFLYYKKKSALVRCHMVRSTASRVPLSATPSVPALAFLHHDSVGSHYTHQKMKYGKVEYIKTTKASFYLNTQLTSRLSGFTPASMLWQTCVTEFNW